MSEKQDKPEEGHAGSFAEQVEQPPAGIVREFWDFLRYNKKWWLTPIIVVLLLVSALVVLTSSSVGPFIYTLI